MWRYPELRALPLAVALLAWMAEPLQAAEGDFFVINTGLAFWVLLVFVLLILLLTKFAWGPILKAVDAREERIRVTIDGANEAREEAQSLVEQQREHLAQARRQADEIIQKGRSAGEAVRAEIEERARAEAEAIVERARMDIARERDAAIEELRRESVDLALAAASRLISRRLEGEGDRRLVESYLTEIDSYR